MIAQKYIAPRMPLKQGMVLLAAFLILFTTGVSALAQSEEQIKKFNQERETYFNETLELNEAEKEAFWPVYNDFNSRKMRLMEQERNSYRYVRQNQDNLSDKEMEESMEQILELKEGIMALDRQYYGKVFPELLGSKKTMDLYMAEWEFRRHLIGKLKGRDDRPGRGQGQGRSGQGRFEPEFQPTD